MKTAPENPRIADADLLRLIRAGERRGAEMLYDSYASFLLLVIYRIVPEPKAAEQALEVTFKKIWCSIEDYDLQKERIYTWMIAIAKKSACETLLRPIDIHENKINSLQARNG